MFGLSYDAERALLFDRIAYAMILQSIPIFFILLHIIPAPWGKTKPSNKTMTSLLLGPLVPPKISWCIMESPNLLWCMACYFNDTTDRTSAFRESALVSLSSSNELPTSTTTTPSIAHYMILFMFFTHYCYRAIVYPYRMSNNTTYMPIVVVIMAFTFCTFNGYLQAQGLCRPFVTFPTTSWERSYQFQFGACLYVAGLTINIRSDAILRQLRQQSAPKQHTIPYGEMFYYVSNPHYMGEIIEWIGYCVASDFSLSSTAFVIYTMANLIPRAVTNHLWYTKHFPTIYPKLHRKAIVPFIW